MDTNLFLKEIFKSTGDAVHIFKDNKIPQANLKNQNFQSYFRVFLHPAFAFDFALYTYMYKVIVMYGLDRMKRIHLFTLYW